MRNILAFNKSDVGVRLPDVTESVRSTNRSGCGGWRRLCGTWAGGGAVLVYSTKYPGASGCLDDAESRMVLWC